ncbi:MAG: hypothetical protein A3J38_05490 [Gammaproteobacteria bacterium RIFCSPHIGHO2_12_FULL_45_9]|nr:MAG: hypothetical protein A3J38_05490 [Gammaproteobacteria bacterium RIFCSPHIGHO2_12_FULL_45_9]
MNYVRHIRRIMATTFSIFLPLMTYAQVTDTTKNTHHQKSTVNSNLNYDTVGAYYGFSRVGVLFDQMEYITTVPTNRLRTGAHVSTGFAKNLTQNWGLGAEFGVGYYGRVEGYNSSAVIYDDGADPANWTYYGFDAAGLVIFKLTHEFWLRGRLGCAVILGQPDNVEDNSTDTNLLWGIGVLYWVAPQLSLTADYTFINGVGFPLNSPAAAPGTYSTSALGISMPQFNVLQLGLEYRFHI